MDVDYGIVGPGEHAIKYLADYLANPSKKLGTKQPRIQKLMYAHDYPHKFHGYPRGQLINYAQYIINGGIAGFETQKGCKNHCNYCIEAASDFMTKTPNAAMDEIKSLVKLGYGHFHLCDSEFNQDLDQCKQFLRVLIQSKQAGNWDFKWALYMLPNRYDEELIQLLKDSNAYLITLSVCSDPKQRKSAQYTLDDVKALIELGKKYEIKIAIDLLIGFPDEPNTAIEDTISFFKTNRPATVGINCYIRLCKTTVLTRIILERPDLHQYLSRTLIPHEDFLTPIFFNRVSIEYIQGLIAEDPLFKIEGLQKTVNYQRV